jgi:hypothetical protein
MSTSEMSTDPPQPGVPAVATPRNGYGVAAMVLGIVGVVAAANGFFLVTLPLALSAGVLATVFGFLGRRRVQRGEADNPGQALAGLIMGPIAAVLAIVAVTTFALSFDGPDERWDGPWGGRWEERGTHGPFDGPS